MCDRGTMMLLSRRPGAVPRVVGWVDIGEAEWPNRAHLRDVFAGFGPVKVRLAARQYQHGAGAMRGELALIELVSQPDVEDTRDHGINAVLRVFVRHHLGSRRESHPNEIRAGFGWITDQYGKPSRWGKGGKGFPLHLFRADDVKTVLVGLMNRALTGSLVDPSVRHDGTPFGRKRRLMRRQLAKP